MSRRATLPLFGLTIFLGAALLFLLQLVFARMVLPLLGGAPAVWNTAMVFYQAVLLAGYSYAHLLSSRCKGRTQLAIHAAVLLLALCCLPFAVPGDWRPPVEGNPAPALLGLLAVSVGLPFFAVSTMSPLLQHWFVSVRHERSADPYFLYAASNAGSLAGLLAYPFVIEPYTALRWQSGAWAAGFAVLAALALVCGWLARKETPREAPHKPEDITAKRKVRWMLSAAVPSSLLLSVTAYISSEIGSVPLLWVLPLALYLVTFILAFSRWVGTGAVRRALPVLLVPVALAMLAGLTTPLALLAALHLAAFFVVAWVCHGVLAEDRPPAENLTVFYLCVSLGGVLGGAFNALLAPALFSRLDEYPLMLAAAAWLGLPGKKPGWPDVAAAVGVALLAWALATVAGNRLWVFGPPLLLCFLMSGNGRRFAVSLGAVLLAGRLLPEPGMRVLAQGRSFFGVHRVVEDDGARLRLLFHGRTVHGIQSLEPELADLPLSYYHPTGPLGQMFAAWDREEPVAAVGLGAGAAAMYGKPGQEFVFHEIDPVVIRYAIDSRWFSYLSRSPAKIGVVAGDARLTLSEAENGRYGLIVLDAYSSDSIPVHLLTREAMAMYLEKLAPGGWLALHLSNLHLDLRPVVAGLARDAGLACLFQEDDEPAPGKTASRWAVLARSPEDLERLDRSGRWAPLPPSDMPVWTDDHSSILPLLDFFW